MHGATWQRLKISFVNFPMYSPVLLIIVGTLLVAIGGLLATKGWNAYSLASQKIKFTKVLASELAVNRKIIRDRTFDPEDPAEVNKVVIFPKLFDTALSGVIASGLFASEDDSPFLTQALRLQQRQSAFNQRLDYAHNAMLVDPNSAHFYRTGIRDGPLRRDIEQELLKLLKILNTNYGITDTDIPDINLGQ